MNDMFSQYIYDHVSEFKMKLYSLSVLNKGKDGKVVNFVAAHELNSFGYFQRSR